MPTTTSVAGSAGISGIGNSGEMNLSTIFAMLQLAMASDKKDQAMALMDDIKAENEVIKKAREMLAKARQIQGSTGSTATAESTEMTAFVAQYGIAFDTSGNDHSHTKEQWDINIKNLESFIESRGMDTQTKMVQLEDLMGKYNSWSQGASKSISDGNQLMQSIMTR
ncbi:MAG: hypothetical protein LBU43_12280 [Candidatus Accumulibacter sp.]|jgi:hypothetical protein|nr:hypothetical protein [Accumulibacter sp.]